MPCLNPPHLPAFEAEVLRLVPSGLKPRSEIARELSVTSESLRLWLKQAELDRGYAATG